MDEEVIKTILENEVNLLNSLNILRDILDATGVIGEKLDNWSHRLRLCISHDRYREAVLYGKPSGVCELDEVDRELGLVTEQMVEHVQHIQKLVSTRRQGLDMLINALEIRADVIEDDEGGS